MALTKFTENVNNIQALSDRPNVTDGITSSELKERFDKAGSDIKNYINNTITEELDEEITTINNSITSITQSLPTDYVRTTDTRLTNSRTCNNTFDNWSTARSNLKVGYGASLPSSADDGAIFFLYE
jgi:hypothetical protein